MGESIAEVGYLAGVCGDDGTDWEKVGVSASGRLKVESEDSGGTDLTDLKDVLDDIKTAIEKIDDLQNALNSIATDELDVVIDGQSADVEVTQTTPADLVTGVHGYISSAWQKQPLQFGYSDRLADAATETNKSAGSHYLDLTAVPSGEIWVVQNISVDYWAGTVAALRIYLYDGSSYYFVKADTSPAIGDPLNWSGQLVLKEGDLVRSEFVTCASTPSIRVSAWGYKMDIDL